LRYSDAPKDKKSYVVSISKESREEILTESAKEESYIKFRI